MDYDATKAGRRHSASDAAVMKAMKQDTFDFAAKMSDYLKALGFEDEDGDGAVAPEEAAAQMGAEAKAIDYASLCEMVCDAVEDALVEVGVVAEEGDAEEAMRPYVEAVAKDMPGEDDDDPEVLVYDGYAVAMLGPAAWRIPYAIEAGEVVVGDPDAWERVEAEWKPVPGAAGVGEMKALGAEVKLLDDGETIVAQAIAYGSPDAPDMSAHADFFTKSTDFWLDAWDRRPMLYHHAMDEGTRDAPVIGAWTKAWQDDAGTWLQGQLDKAHRYYAAIKELARRGLLRISTDSAPHLVVRERQPNGTNAVKRWPIMAASLTPTPAEPRLLPAELKAMLADLGLSIDTGAHEARPVSTPREAPTGAKAADDGRAAALLARITRLKETTRP